MDSMIIKNNNNDFHMIERIAKIEITLIKLELYFLIYLKNIQKF